jgi:hypothetical protein
MPVALLDAMKNALLAMALVLPAALSLPAAVGRAEENAATTPSVVTTSTEGASETEWEENGIARRSRVKFPTAAELAEALGSLGAGRLSYPCEVLDMWKRSAARGASEILDLRLHAWLKRGQQVAVWLRPKPYPIEPKGSRSRLVLQPFKGSSRACRTTAEEVRGLFASAHSLALCAWLGVARPDRPLDEGMVQHAAELYSHLLVAAPKAAAPACKVPPEVSDRAHVLATQSSIHEAAPPPETSPELPVSSAPEKRITPSVADPAVPTGVVAPHS